MGKNNKKERIDIVYSTNPNFNYDYQQDENQETLPPNQQDLKVKLDKKQRKGKSVTLVTGFIGQDENLKDLGKKIKSKCATGGSIKDGEIIIQGDFRNKVLEILINEGYKVKLAGS